jgi:hypothetical protein
MDLLAILRGDPMQPLYGFFQSSECSFELHDLPHKPCDCPKPKSRIQTIANWLILEAIPFGY